MKRKSSRGIIGVLIVLVAITLFFSNKLMNNVAAASSKCNNLQELQSYYKLSYNWSDDDQYLIFSAKHGVFRIVDVDHPEYFSNSLVKDSNGYYKIDGGVGIVDKDHSLKLHLKNVRTLGVEAGDIVRMKLALSETDTAHNCISMSQFQSTHSGATFDSGTIEVELPRGAFATTEATTLNTNYNGLCVALREGRDPTGTINVAGGNPIDYMKLYNASYREDYRALIPGCWQQYTTSNYDAASLREIVRIALSSVYEAHHMSIGDEATDHGTAWMINFDNTKAKAESQNTSADRHTFYTDNARKFYINKGGRLAFDFAKDSEKASIGMKCNYKAKSSTDISNLAEHKADGSYNIDANAQYYYAYNEVNEKVTYVWNYTKGSNAKDTETKDACTRTCEEAVEVKYGPPVASVAGQCFEYQVQVTSRVRCRSKILIKPPTEPKVCNPVPYCNSIPGHIHQAGANDDYKACIQKCDGGKYTKKCSDKCYKKVYGSKEASSDLIGNDESFEETVGEKLGLSDSWFGGYYYWSSGKIRWKSTSRGSTYARYYKDNEYGRTSRDHGSYYPVSGYKKRIISNSPREYCHDKCKFKKCSKKQYLNRSEAQTDYKANLKRYNEAIGKCKASATCTTKTAKFTIKTNYINGKKEVVTVDYPYTGNTPTNPEKLGSDEASTACSTNSSTVSSSSNIILNYAGCYKECGTRLQYHTRWSFPGSYINIKTGELSFKPQNGSSWENRDDKFCIPFDAQDVNQAWWRYYYSIYDKTHVTSMDDPNVKDKCVTIEGTTPISDTDIKSWNINAVTKNFGYFGWNFNIDCFYALNRSSMTPKNPPVDTEKCTQSKDPVYNIRTVDLKNMFPGESGSGTRAAGWNWSSNANVLEINGKNKEFESKPSVYAEEVQSLGYNVYKDSNLDYEFNLSKDLLKKIKSGEKNYTNYQGDMVTQHGMYSYKSKAIRSGAFAASGNKVLKESAIGCNNVENYASTSCKDIAKEGK